MMSPNQDKTSNGKRIDMIYAHNYFVFYSCKILRIDLALIPLLGIVAENQKISYASPRSIYGVI